MSEYQYYEFRAIDRPLADADLKRLRAISTRARITTTSFVNHYEWGDFKGDPNQFMERYFDLFLYLANWGARRFSLRLPKRLTDANVLAPFIVDEESGSVRTAGDYVIADVFREDLDGEDWHDGQGWLDALAPLRADVLEGDLRLFYLVWLMALETGVVMDEDLEPFAGIAPLTPALEAFAEFFCIDGDLVAAASSASRGHSTIEPPRSALAAAIDSLGGSEKNALLLRLYDGDPHVRAELRRRCRPDIASSVADRPRRRTAAELRATAERLAEERRRDEEKRLERERRRREQEEAKARRLRLDALALRRAAAWKEVDDLIALRNGSAYEKVTVLLGDLRALALEQDTDDQFHQRIIELRDLHRSKPRLIERLVAAGLI